MIKLRKESMLETRELPKSSCLKRTIPKKSKKVHLHTQTKIREKPLQAIKAKRRTKRILNQLLMVRHPLRLEDKIRKSPI
jgi:hypothetical protein